MTREEKIEEIPQRARKNFLWVIIARNVAPRRS